jgi:effector-binding domain-containing protein
MELREEKSRPTMCIRTTTAVGKLPEVLGEGYGEIMQYAQQRGIEMAGAPYVLYFNDDMEKLQIELGFPVFSSTAAEKQGRVEPGVLPGGRTAVTMHIGPYAAIGEAYDRLTSEVTSEGHEPTGVCYEVYIDDPRNTPEEKLRTEICFPLLS